MMCRLIYDSQEGGFTEKVTFGQAAGWGSKPEKYERRILQEERIANAEILGKKEPGLYKE